MASQPQQDATGSSLGSVELSTITRGQPETAGAAEDWLCAWCLHRVARERDRYPIEGQDEFAFTNPAGVRFEIITFESAAGCEAHGTPTLEHTWFAGYAWSFCACQECGQHLGWQYTGPNTFVGLIKDRLVRAQLVMN